MAMAAAHPDARSMHRYDEETVARTCHAAAAELQRARGSGPFLPPWEALTPEQRQAAIESVRLAREGATPRALHQQWTDTMTAAGWVHGPVKDPAAKTHPNLVDYRELPAAQRDKDRLFLAIVTALTDVAT